MSILQIARLGHPVLRQVARPVGPLDRAGLDRLVADMMDTLAESGGVGLAAPQVHESLRVVMFRVPPWRGGGVEVPLTILADPVIEPLDGPQVSEYESCLSIPGLTGLVPRWSRIRYGGWGMDGAWVECEAEGFHARVVQHECDHLDGVVYSMRMDDLVHFGFSDQIRRMGSVDAE